MTTNNFCTRLLINAWDECGEQMHQSSEKRNRLMKCLNKILKLNFRGRKTLTSFCNMTLFTLPISFYPKMIRHNGTGAQPQTSRMLYQEDHKDGQQEHMNQASYMLYKEDHKGYKQEHTDQLVNSGRSYKTESNAKTELRS